MLVGDCVVDEAGPAHEEMFTQWAEHMVGQGLSRAEAQRLFEQWAGEDRYYPLRDELAMLREAGFEQPECFWKQGPIAVYGAYR